jgi:hypothetical protein
MPRRRAAACRASSISTSPTRFDFHRIPPRKAKLKQTWFYPCFVRHFNIWEQNDKTLAGLLNFLYLCNV